MDDKITERIASWILKSHIQIQDGPESGAVAGWLHAEEHPSFAYTEITGYYLTCLAFMHRIGRSDPCIASNANRAVSWLHRKCRNGQPPLTRYYPQQDVGDWRNDAFFSFYVAMVLRGLSSVRGLVDERSRQETFDALARHLCRFVSSEGRLMPFIQLNGHSLPARWSTTPGPFQLKTAAALLFSGGLVAEEAKKAALHVYHQWRSSILAPLRPEEFHAAMYAIEGLILFGIHGCDEAWKAAADKYRQVVEQLSYERSDVIAQALRAGCLLRGRGFLQPSEWDQKLAELAAALQRFVGKDGAVYYCDALLSPQPHRNAWSSMFAYQAFTFYQRFRADVSSVLC